MTKPGAHPAVRKRRGEARGHLTQSPVTQLLTAGAALACRRATIRFATASEMIAVLQAVLAAERKARQRTEPLAAPCRLLIAKLQRGAVRAILRARPPAARPAGKDNSRNGPDSQRRLSGQISANSGRI